MRTWSETEAFFREHLRSTARRLAALRLLLWLRWLPLGSAVPAGLLNLSWHYVDRGRVVPWGPIAAWAAVLAAAGLIAWSSRRLPGRYAAGYENRIVRPLIEFVDPEFRLASGERLGPSVMESGLFEIGVDTIHTAGEVVDLPVGQGRARFARLLLQTHRDQGPQPTVFAGLFAEIDFNKEFPGETWVLTDDLEPKLGWLAREWQKLDRSRGELVELEDPEFERVFKVYSTDQVEARYILTPALMERLLAVRRWQDAPAQFSFLEGRMYAAIPDERQVPLEEELLLKHSPSLGSIPAWASVPRPSPGDLDRVRRLHEYLVRCRHLVGTLHLENRIWSKA